MGVMIVVAMHRFPSDGVARKADHQGDRSGKAFDHGSMFPSEETHVNGGVPTPFLFMTAVVRAGIVVTAPGEGRLEVVGDYGGMIRIA